MLQSSEADAAVTNWQRLISAGADWTDLQAVYKLGGVEAELQDRVGVTWGAAKKITGLLALGAHAAASDAPLTSEWDRSGRSVHDRLERVDRRRQAARRHGGALPVGGEVRRHRTHGGACVRPCTCDAA
jgi:hypothetical protein